MIKKRKALLFILTIVSMLALAFGLTGCFGGSGTSSGGTSSSGNYYTVTIMSDNEAVGTYTFISESGNTINGSYANKMGYELLGYYTSDGVMVFNANGVQQSNVIIDQNLTLYLRYSVKSYTFVYMYMDDSGSYVTYNEQTVAYGSELTSFISAPEKTGYDFKGWAKYSTGDYYYSNGTTPVSSTFTNADYIINSDGQVILYAIYGAKTYTVTLNYNLSGYEDRTITVNYGETIPNLSSYYVDTGSREVVGWSSFLYEEVEYTSPVYMDMTLYAIWKDYKYVSFVYTETDIRQVKYYSNATTTCSLPLDATIAGYTLDGWYTTATFSGNPVTGAAYALLADTYYAKWKIATYTITFVYDGENFEDITYTVESGTITLPTISVYGYNFYGWCTDAALKTTPITKVVPSTSTGGYGDMTLYPKLEKYSTTVSYYFGNSKVGSLTLEYGESYNIPVPTSKLGSDKKFKYWYMLDGDTTIILTDVNGNSLTNWTYTGSSCKVFAEYVQLYSVTVTYTDPVTGSTSTDSYGYKNVGDTVTIYAKAYINYALEGFYINNALVSTSDTFEYVVEAADVVITAVYSLKVATEFNSTYDFPYTVYYYNGHYYAVVEASKAWSTAENWCEFYGGHLVTITSSDENTFVGSLLTKIAGSSKYWIGANDYATEGTWVWSTGETWSYTNWASGEPNNGSSNQDYAAMYVANYLWDDDYNSSSYPFVIEWDSFNSFITTVTETLTDVNGDEVTLTLYKYNSHYYAVVDTSMLWTAAETYSEYIGGHLVTITSSDENNFVSLLLTNTSAGASSYWFGGTDYEVEGTWKWVTGETWSYTNWSSNQPDNSQSNQDYAVIGTSNYAWDDAYNTGSYPFVIEWESLSDVGTIKQLYEMKYISTASEFLEIQNNTAGYYILESDITLSSAWTPVDFSGTLLGNGHTVSGITVETSGNAGVFLTVTGTIENITFEVTVNSTSTSKVYVGGAVAQLNGGTLRDITVKGTVTSISGNAYTGGVVGIYSTGTISGLTNYATVTSGTTTNDVGAGGVIGHADSYDFTDLTNYGNVTSYGEVGGIIGFMHLFYNGGTTAVMSGLKNYGILISYSSCSCGGIFGDIKGSVNSSSAYSFTLSDCYNYGSVTTDSCNAGGIIGYMSLANSGSGVFTFAGYNLYNEGNITSSGYYVGGLVGRGEAKTNTSYISGTSSAKISGQYYVGGIAGYLSNIAVKDSSNAGSTITATSYFTSNSTNYVYVGGYVGYGYSVSGCDNAVNITYNYSAWGVAGVAGELTGTITNCSNSGNITALSAYCVAGVCGRIVNIYTGSVSGLTNNGTIKGYQYVGGVLGAIYTSVSISADYTLEISDLTNEGGVTGTSFDVGGVIGHINIANTSSGKNIAVHMTELKNSGSVTGSYHVGGVLGYAVSDHSSSYITSSSSSGAITGTYYVGGIAGYMSYISLTDSSNAGSTVTATSYTTTSSDSYVYLGGYVGYGYCVSGCNNAVNLTYNYEALYIGGIAGYLDGTVSNCSNSGNITAAKASRMGGIVGRLTYAVSGVVTMSNLTNTGDISGADYVGGIFGRLYYNTSASYNTTLSLSTVSNSGNITVSGSYAGGIAGHVYLKNTHNSYTYSMYASDLTNTGAITAANYCYGIFGGGEIETSSTVTGYVSTGTINCSGSYYGKTYTGSNITFSD